MAAFSSEDNSSVSRNSMTSISSYPKLSSKTCLVTPFFMQVSRYFLSPSGYSVSAPFPYQSESSLQTNQLNSYHSQIAYYTKLINENPEWVLYDLYADEGITGTSIEKRDEFKRMIADCREGKIKRILVKSVSRFARNTTELLETTRELKDLGVVVVFEEQGFDTSQMFGEMQLAMFAMAAQEESLSISRNIQWSYQTRMENGTFLGTRTPYGYKLTDGQLEVVADEAKIVNDIFNWYLSGVSIEKIAAKLNEKGVSAHHGRKLSLIHI